MPEVTTPANIPPPTLEEVAASYPRADVGKVMVDEIAKVEDDILEAHGRGDLKLYEKLLSDDQVYPTFRQRRNAVIAREVKVDPSGEAPIDIEAADFIRDQIARVSFDAATYKMLTGIFYGRGVAECMLGIEGSRVVLNGIKVRKSKRFVYTTRGELRMVTDGGPVALPERKMWQFRCGADDDDDPNGRGLGHFVYWPVWLKRNALRFWALFLETLAMPTPVGTHPASWKDKQQEDFLNKLEAVRAGGKLAVPAGTKVELLAAARDSGGDYQKFIELLNAAISKVVLMQTMTTDQGSSLSQAQVHLSVADVAAKTDSDLLTESFTQGPVRWLVEWNFPGARVPLVYRDFTVAKDLAASATRDQALSGIGYRPTPDRVRETYGDGYEPFTPPTDMPAPSAEAAMFAERRRVAEMLRRVAGRADANTSRSLRRLAEFAERRAASGDIERMLAGEGWRRVLGPEVASIEELLADCSSLEEARDRLGELAQRDPTQLTSTLAQVMFAARVGGNAEFEADEEDA